MTRHPLWRARLEVFVGASARRPFAWGEHDCCLWALGAIDAVCGTRLADQVRGQYNSSDGAVAYAASRGWRTAADACRDVCGEPLPRVGAMRDGDLCARALPSFPFGTVLVRVGDTLMGPDDCGTGTLPFRVVLLSPAWTAFPVGD